MWSCDNDDCKCNGIVGGCMQTNEEPPPLNIIEGAIFVDAENIVFITDD